MDFLRDGGIILILVVLYALMGITVIMLVGVVFDHVRVVFDRRKERRDGRRRPWPPVV